MTVDLEKMGTEQRFPPRLSSHNAGDVFVALFCLWWLLLAAFRIFPQIDIAVAELFFRRGPCLLGQASDYTCGHFPYSVELGFRLLRESLFVLPYAAAALLVWLLAISLREHGTSFQPLRVRNLKVALGALILGPGLLVNVWLKTFAHRPRPRQTNLFGGSFDFVHAGSFVGECVRNCSFVSGEAASAGWLFCLIFIIPQPARSALALPIIAVAILTPALRVAFGGHYLSDVVLGWLSSLIIFSALLALSQTTHHRKFSGA